MENEHAGERTETSSPHVVSFTRQPSRSCPRNISASSLKLNTGNTSLPIVTTSSPLQRCSTINQNRLLPIRRLSTLLHVTCR